MLKIRTYVLGMVSTNVYVVSNEETKEAIVIDAAANAPKLEKLLEKDGLALKAVLLTHGHFDHIMAAETLAKAHGVPIYAPEKEYALLNDAQMNLSAQFDVSVVIPDFVPVRDGEALKLLGTDWKVLETPGHTAGSVCYLVERESPMLLFSGDTLFHESMGRTDLPTGSQSAILQSIAERLLVLPDDTRVYPGHEEETTIGHEKQYNPAAIIAKLG